jgi:hypothetical protein
MVSRPESRYRESIIATLRTICSRTTGGGIMFKRSRLRVNRPLENAEKTSEFGLGSELGCNPDDLRVELAGYWSRLLVRVKEQSEARTQMVEVAESQIVSAFRCLQTSK